MMGLVGFSGWITGIVAQVFAFLGLTVGKKTLYATAAVAAYLLLTTAFVLAIKALFAGIVVALPALPSEAFYFLPQNVSVCFASVFTARMARFVYDYNVETLKLVSYVT